MSAPLFKIGVATKSGDRQVFKLHHREIPDIQTAVELTKGEFQDAERILVLVPKEV